MQVGRYVQKQNLGHTEFQKHNTKSVQIRSALDINILVLGKDEYPNIIEFDRFSLTFRTHSIPSEQETVPTESSAGYYANTHTHTQFMTRCRIEGDVLVIPV